MADEKQTEIQEEQKTEGFVSTDGQPKVKTKSKSSALKSSAAQLEQQQPQPPVQPTQMIAVAAEKPWWQRNAIPMLAGFMIAATMCTFFAITASTYYNSGFDSGKRAGVEETRGTYAKSPWYIRLGSAVTGELPR